MALWPTKEQKIKFENNHPEVRMEVGVRIFAQAVFIRVCIMDLKLYLLGSSLYVHIVQILEIV